MPLRAFLSNRDVWALTGLLLLAVLLPISFGKSEAAFVANSNNPNSVFSSASSFNTVSVSLTNPGSPLRGTVIFNAVATSDRGMGTVVFQTSPAGADTWTTRCTNTATPFSCSFDTTGVTDGLYDVRAIATDSAGYSQTDTVTGRRIDNTVPVGTTTDPGSPLTGPVSVTGNATDTAGSGVASTTVQYRLGSGGSWVSLCTQAAASATCSWNTAALSDGLYDLRTIATDVAGNVATTGTVVADRRLDNVAPTATMTAPAANLAGSVTLSSTSADSAGGSGVASVRYEYKPSSGSTWSTACTNATSPYSCSFNTTTATDGLYDFRAVAIDGANLTGASAAVTSRRIDNTAPAATMGALGANISGSVSLTSTSSDGGTGVASVQYQYKLTSDSTWTNACSATTPFTCAFNTATVSDGVYDFRVLATDNVGNTGASTPVFSRRIDNTNPTVTMGALPAWIDGTVTLTSTPADAGGISSVRYEYRLGAGVWQTACTSGGTPYSCSFNTAVLTNGSLYEFRAIATDNATPGRTGTSASVSARADHVSPTVTMTTPADYLAGSVTLASTTADTGGSGVASVLYEYKLTSGTTWSTACPAPSTPFSCAFNTASVADNAYDFRATVTDNVGRTTVSTVAANRRIDNTNPITATLAAVGTNLAGNVTFNGTSADNAGGSGVGSWKVQTSPTGAGNWTDLCTDTVTPFTTCTGNVDGFADGLYDFRAVTTDRAGNTLASAVQTNRRVDTDGPVTSVASPASGTRVSGNVTMTANATDPAGVTNVEFQVFVFGNWFTFCQDNTATYTCTGDSTQVADGTYQTRVIATDGLGHQTTSATTTLIIDNTDPGATGIDSASAGATDGRIDAGDAITFTWSEPMAPASIMTGWNGGSQPIEVRVYNNANSDTIDFYTTGGTHLNITEGLLLDTNANYVSANATFAGTMVMTGNSVTVTIGAQSGAGGLNTVNTGNPDLEWDSANETTDVAGNTATGNAVTEAGNDIDF